MPTPKLPRPKMERYTFERFNREFPDDAACLEWLKNRLYPDGIRCDVCEKITPHYRVKSRPSYSCQWCGKHVHPTANTIFHKSPTSLRIWFYAIYLMSATRCGVSAKQIERETGVTYKCAWRMFKQIRSMLEDETPLGGRYKPVEMDECEIGGFTRRKRRPANPRATVIGMVERGGRVKAVVAPDRKMPTIRPIVKKYIKTSTTLMTDDFVSYDGLGYRGWNHKRINHSLGNYVMGDVHTQTIEGFWSHVKNSIRGVYKQVGREYLQSYLNEYCFRYSHRRDTKPMFTSFLEQVRKEPLALPAPSLEESPF